MEEDENISAERSIKNQKTVCKVVTLAATLATPLLSMLD
jgi:hypothetical protein